MTIYENPYVVQFCLLPCNNYHAKYNNVVDMSENEQNNVQAAGVVLRFTEVI